MEVRFFLLATAVEKKKNRGHEYNVWLWLVAKVTNVRTAMSISNERHFVEHSIKGNDLETNATLRLDRFCEAQLFKSS